MQLSKLQIAVDGLASCQLPSYRHVPELTGSIVSNDGHWQPRMDDKCIARFSQRKQVRGVLARVTISLSLKSRSSAGGTESSCAAVVLYRSCQAFIHGSAKLTAAPLASLSVQRTVGLDQAGHPPLSITHSGAQTRLGYIITRTRPPCGRACQNGAGASVA